MVLPLFNFSTLHLHHYFAFTFFISITRQETTMHAFQLFLPGVLVIISVLGRPVPQTVSKDLPSSLWSWSREHDPYVPVYAEQYVPRGPPSGKEHGDEQDTKADDAMAAYIRAFKMKSGI